jgi:hypothetical protein
MQQGSDLNPKVSVEGEAFCALLCIEMDVDLG